MQRDFSVRLIGRWRWGETPPALKDGDVIVSYSDAGGKTVESEAYDVPGNTHPPVFAAFMEREADAFDDDCGGREGDPAEEYLNRIGIRVLRFRDDENKGTNSEEQERQMQDVKRAIVDRDFSDRLVGRWGDGETPRAEEGNVVISDSGINYAYDVPADDMHHFEEWVADRKFNYKKWKDRYVDDEPAADYIKRFGASLSVWGKRQMRDETPPDIGSEHETAASYSAAYSVAYSAAVAAAVARERVEAAVANSPGDVGWRETLRRACDVERRALKAAVEAGVRVHTPAKE